MSLVSIKKLFEALLQNRNVFFVFCAIFVACAALFFVLGRIFARIEMNARLKELISAERADAVKRSRAILGGLAGEQVAPYLPGFPCNAADARFVGKPVDFVAFPGAALGQPIQEILFIEVKSGEAALSAREKEIRECIESGRVRFELYNVPE